VPDTPRFMIVGPPRSGTTLVQRLASELPGVRVPPETHFFDQYVAGLIERRSFPLDRTALSEELRAYLAIGDLEGLTLDPAAVVERLGGTCASPVALFAAIVETLCGGAEVCGEKTPDHLRWWRPLAHVLPDLRIVAVLRDPRATVASGRRMPWSTHPHGVLAEAWRLGALEVARMADALPPERRLVLRYEDVVADPDAARASIARLIGVAQTAGPALGDDELAALRLPREWWKDKVSGPVSGEWVDKWRDELTESEAREIALVCREEMSRWGYDAGDAAEPDGAAEEALAGLEWQRELWRSWLEVKLAEVAAFERLLAA
jgi:hypothetical protein